jgi:hypothetical protein
MPDLCLAAGVGGTTALRWISTMVERGFVISEPDGHQADRAFVTLAPGMSAALRRCFAEVIEGA